MSYPLKQSSTAQPLVFLLVDSTDHVTGKTGLTPTVTLSKAGGAFASPAGAVTEMASGWYKCAGNATDTATLGPLILHATGTAADPTDVVFTVVAYDPQDSVRLGLTALPNAAAGANGGLPTGNASAQVTVAGFATGAIDAAAIAADAIGSSELAATAASEIASAVRTELTTELGRVDAAITTRASQTSLDTVDDFLDTEVAAIKAKTDNLPASPANEATLTTITGYLDTEVAAILAAVDTEVAAIKAKTDNLPAAPAATGDIPTANANADALLDRANGIETSLTLRQAMRLLAAASAGKLSGAATTTITIRNVGDSKDRIVATVDGSGNRSALTTDVS